ncbi:MAG: murein biosynthesis integral membrane protein MurJ [Dongiaceae bacterium]
MSLVRSIATVGGYTMASRVLGFVRDILIARVLGTGFVADAFFVSQRFPNLFRSLFAEGAFNASFVPLFARHLTEEGTASARVFAEQVLAVMVTVLLLFTVAAQCTMPWLMHVIAPGFAEHPEKFALAVQFTQITFPYLLFMALTALQGGVMNALGRFAHAAAAPILLNVVMILALVLVAPFTGMPGHVLAWAMAAAGIAQFLWLVIACHYAGIPLRLPLPRLTPEVRRLLRLMVPGIVGAGVMQINLVIGTIIASSQAAAVSYLYYADRIYQLPLAVIGSAVGVVLLPELARHLRSGRTPEALATQSRCIEFSMLLTLPAAVALIVVPVPVIGVLFQRGAFLPSATGPTALALAAYSAGLPAYVLVKALTPGFFAREDTATPFRYAVISLAANIALSLSLFPFIGFVGIAASTAAASWINVAMLGTTLWRRGHLVFDAGLRRRLPRILLASAAMGAACWALADALWPAFSGTLPVKAGALALLVGGGLAGFAAAALLLGAVDRAELRRLVRRRRGKPGPGTPAA